MRARDEKNSLGERNAQFFYPIEKNNKNRDFPVQKEGNTR
jgi:hypothetical protein